MKNFPMRKVKRNMKYAIKSDRYHDCNSPEGEILSLSNGSDGFDSGSCGSPLQEQLEEFTSGLNS